jgi:hypothetical protein
VFLTAFIEPDIDSGDTPGNPPISGASGNDIQSAPAGLC